MSVITAARHPLLSHVRHGARWVGQDADPWFLEAADERERWLEFINGKGQLGRLLPRLRDRASQRDDTLAEIGVGFLLEKRCGLPIVAWDPLGANGKKGECLVALPTGQNLTDLRHEGAKDSSINPRGLDTASRFIEGNISLRSRAARFDTKPRSPLGPSA